MTTVRDAELQRRSKGRVRLELLLAERGPLICKSPPTSAVTFFRGSTAEAGRCLDERVAAVVGATPATKSTFQQSQEASRPLNQQLLVHRGFPRVLRSSPTARARGGLNRG